MIANRPCCTLRDATGAVVGYPDRAQAARFLRRWRHQRAALPETPTQPGRAWSHAVLGLRLDVPRASKGPA